jgi:hypothetical protein
MSSPMTYVYNSGELDLDTLRVMGVSVKLTENPIGYFGTGMKYAIATLLRTGHIVALCTGGKNYVFGARDEEIRGQTFGRVYMNDEALPFTTELGRNWQVWQAFRELHANALDEGGGTSDKFTEADTMFIVNGEEFHDCYVGRKSIFLDSQPFTSGGGVDIHRGSSHYVFYRGVRAHKLINPSLYTYNITAQMKLTEDRTLESAWDVEYRIAGAMTAVDDPGVAAAIMKGGDRYEHSLSMDWHTPSETIAHAALAQRSNANAHKSVGGIVEKFTAREAMYPETDLTEAEAVVAQKAFALLAKLGCDLDIYEVQFCETLGPNVVGLYHGQKNQIYVARIAVENGERYLAQTLYEEWMHKRHQLTDNSRAMQDFLLTKLFAGV